MCGKSVAVKEFSLGPATCGPVFTMRLRCRDREARPPLGPGI